MNATHVTGQLINAQLGTGYFRDEEAHIAAYLNKQYYHFQ